MQFCKTKEIQELNKIIDKQRSLLKYNKVQTKKRHQNLETQLQQQRKKYGSQFRSYKEQLEKFPQQYESYSINPNDWSKQVQKKLMEQSLKKLRLDKKLMEKSKNFQSKLSESQLKLEYKQIFLKQQLARLEKNSQKQINLQNESIRIFEQEIAFIKLISKEAYFLQNLLKPLSVYKQQTQILVQTEGKIEIKQNTIIIENPSVQLRQLIQLTQKETQNLLILSIGNKLQKGITNPLTPESAKILSQISLPNIKEIEIQNNLIMDEGLQYLCKAQFPQLDKINLNDNEISMNGLNHLFQNTWPLTTKYTLDYVNLPKGGYYLHIGEYINTIKTVKLTDCKRIDELYETNSEDHILSAMNLLLNTPDENQLQIIAQSQAILEQQKRKSVQNQRSIATVFLKLKQQFKDGLVFQQKQSVKSKMSSKILFAGSNDQRIKATQIFKDSPSFEFSFGKFKHNFSQIKRFQQWFHHRNEVEFGIKKEDIKVHSITQGSIRLEFSKWNDPSRPLHQGYQKKLQFSSFFNKFVLDPNGFDSRGDFSFPKSADKAKVQNRGGLPYYQPILGTGFGIKVKDQYEDNIWLDMNGNPKQWAIAFHGVNIPINPVTNPQLLINKANSQSFNVFENIMQGRKQGEMLIQGPGQGYQSGICKRTNQVIGKGIYSSPHFLTSLYSYASGKSGDCHLVLQCRVKPDKIRFTDSEDFWVLNSSKDIRPYRIILFSDDDIRKLQIISAISIQAHQSIYGQTFKYSNCVKKS